MEQAELETSTPTIVFNEARAANYLKISLRTMQRLRKSHAVGYCRVRRQIRYRQADLERFLADNYLEPVCQG
jgi:excisionase family DNA binding protein